MVRSSLTVVAIASLQARGGLDRLEDLHIAGAAAEVSLEGVGDLLARRAGVLVQEGARRHDEAGRAVSALDRAALGEGALQRVQFLAVGQPFNGSDLPLGH